MGLIKNLGLCSIISLFSAYADQEADMTKSKAGVISQLRGLMQPSSKLEEELVSDDKPYLQIIKSEDDRSTLVYRCRNTKGKSIVDAVESVISRVGTVEESKDENMLVINDTNAKINEIRQLITALDVTVPQILVEAKVIEVYTNDQLEREFEFDYNKGVSIPGSKLSTDSGSRPAQFDFSPFSAGISGSYHRLHYFINWLQTANDAKILSSPNLTVSLGSTASIVTGEDLPIQSTSSNGSTTNTSINYKRTGIQLQVNPIRINDKTVRLSVTPEVSTVTRYESIEQNGTNTNIPVISVRNVKTELTVRDGEVIMLGGLYSSEELKTEKKVPYLSDIPLLGWFFTSVDNTTVLKQLVFFLKVSIINNSTETFADLDKNASDMRKAGEIIKDSKSLFPAKEKEEKTETEVK